MRSTWKVETFVPMLMTAGFVIHLINASRHLLTGSSDVAEIISWPVDLCLFALMLFCSVALIARRKTVFAAYDLATAPRRVGYWVITGYITASLPGHLFFLTTGSTVYFDVFPWWFSLLIMAVYLVMIGYFVSLRPVARTSQRLGEPHREANGAVR
ncbi:hypothetical protein [Mycolicibacterium palauense]|uniref:hypothetical protein n=1 Tax=Mycolicibacterium palauense TaxID=2034511 RepID=UPI000BFEE1B7|nr:hypothetical protein [Mycolicibacterium palauense]